MMMETLLFCMFQFNLFSDDFSRNLIEIYDGPDFVDFHQIATLTAESSDQVHVLYNIFCLRNLELCSHRLLIFPSMHCLVHSVLFRLASVVDVK